VTYCTMYITYVF